MIFPNFFSLKLHPKWSYEYHTLSGSPKHIPHRFWDYGLHTMFFTPKMLKFSLENHVKTASKSLQNTCIFRQKSEILELSGGKTRSKMLGWHSYFVSKSRTHSPPVLVVWTSYDNFCSTKSPFFISKFHQISLEIRLRFNGQAQQDSDQNHPWPSSGHNSELRWSWVGNRCIGSFGNIYRTTFPHV